MYSTNKTDRHDITEILLRAALNTITLTLILKSLEINNQIESPSHEFFNIGIEVFQGETRVTGRVLLVEQELLTLPVHLCSPRILVAFVLLGL